MNKALFSSASAGYETPDALFKELDAEFHFTLDPCATRENAKCPRFYTEEVDGLSQDWLTERVFMNPPYGRQVGKWIEKAYRASLAGALVVCLIPARTDTSYWHGYVMKGEIRFLRGRLRFKVEGQEQGPAPFPSAIVIFRPPFRWTDTIAPLPL